MAKMFCTPQETADKLHVSINELSQFVASNKLREFRDRNRILYAAHDVEDLAQELKLSEGDSVLDLSIPEDASLSILDNDDARFPPRKLSEDEALLILNERGPENEIHDDFGRHDSIPLLDERLSSRPSTRQTTANNKFSKNREPAEQTTDFANIPAAPDDPAEKLQSLPTSLAIQALTAIDMALALSSTLDSPLGKACIKIINISNFDARPTNPDQNERLALQYANDLRVGEWEQVKQTININGEQLTTSLATEHLTHIREIVILSLSRQENPPRGDIKSIIDAMPIIRGVFTIEAFCSSLKRANPDLIKHIDKIERSLAKHTAH